MPSTTGSAMSMVVKTGRRMQSSGRVITATDAFVGCVLTHQSNQAVRQDAPYGRLTVCVVGADWTATATPLASLLVPLTTTVSVGFTPLITSTRLPRRTPSSTTISTALLSLTVNTLL